MDNRNNSSFWPSYVDVMTTLFAITLILFAVSFGRFKIKEKQLQSIVDEYDNILTVYSTVGRIDSTGFFGYDQQYLKHLFRINVEYQTREYAIDKLKLDLTNPVEAEQKRDSIVAAGRMVKETIEALETTDSNKRNIKFLVIIEGQSSKVLYNESDWKNNYTLSYMRAQYLNEFWKRNGIDLSSIPKCELIISGSGEAGVPRIVPDENKLHSLYPNAKDYAEHWVVEEEKNQRFLIHIVPVIGNIEVTKDKIDELKGKK